MDPSEPRSIPAQLTPAAARLVLIVWLAFGVALTVRTVLRPASHTVFPVLAGGADRWVADQPVYSDYKPLDYFRYPPAFAVLLRPLAALGLLGGGILWGWLNLTVYGAGLWYFVREVLPGCWTSLRQASFLLLGLLGGLAGLWNGQSNALVTGLMLLGAVALVRRSWWASAALLSAAVLVKLTPLAPVLLLVALWPRRLASRLAVCLAVVLVLPFLTRPPSVVAGQYAGWVRQCRDLSGERWPGFRDAWTVYCVAECAVTEGELHESLRQSPDAPAYRALQLLSGAAALAGCLRLRRLGVEPRTLVSWTLGIGMGWLLLFGPASEHPTYVFIAPFLAWGATQSQLRPAGRPLILTANVLVLLLCWGAVRYDLRESPWMLLPLPVGCGLYLVWLAGLPPLLPVRAGSSRTAPA